MFPMIGAPLIKVIPGTDKGFPGTDKLFQKLIKVIPGTDKGYSRN